jgi:hypothetical protein
MNENRTHLGRVAQLSLAALLTLGLLGCPAKQQGEQLAKLHVLCSAPGAADGVGKTLDGTTEPPDQGFACEPGSQMSFSYDNNGNYGYLTIFAVTRDDIIFYLPNSKDGQSMPIQTSGTNVALPDRVTVPPKVRDVMALFTREPLKAQEVDRRTREVTLGQLPGTEIRVRLSKAIGPID